MLDGRAHAVPLYAFDVGRRTDAGDERILAEVLEVAPAERMAMDAKTRCEQDIEIDLGGFGANHIADLMEKRGIERTGQERRAGEVGRRRGTAHTGGAIARLRSRDAELLEVADGSCPRRIMPWMAKQEMEHFLKRHLIEHIVNRGLAIRHVKKRACDLVRRLHADRCPVRRLHMARIGDRERSERAIGAQSLRETVGLELESRRSEHDLPLHLKRRRLGDIAHGTANEHSVMTAVDHP